MNILSKAIKSESRWLFLLTFLAICHIAIPLTGQFAMAAGMMNLVTAGWALYKISKQEKKEFDPRVAFREFSLQNRPNGAMV